MYLESDFTTARNKRTPQEVSFPNEYGLKTTVRVEYLSSAQFRVLVTVRKPHGELYKLRRNERWLPREQHEAFISDLRGRL